MAERTCEQIGQEIMRARDKQLIARGRGDTATEQVTEVRIGVLLKQWQAMHDDELLENVAHG
jgi:hypothetical protein